MRSRNRREEVLDAEGAAIDAGRSRLRPILVVGD
jgi:hypothetical protein